MENTSIGDCFMKELFLELSMDRWSILIAEGKDSKSFINYSSKDL